MKTTDQNDSPFISGWKVCVRKWWKLLKPAVLPDCIKVVSYCSRDDKLTQPLRQVLGKKPKIQAKLWPPRVKLWSEQNKQTKKTGKARALCLLLVFSLTFSEDGTSPVTWKLPPEHSPMLLLTHRSFTRLCLSGMSDLCINFLPKYQSDCVSLLDFSLWIFCTAFERCNFPSEFV